MVYYRRNWDKLRQHGPLGLIQTLPFCHVPYLNKHLLLITRGVACEMRIHCLEVFCCSICQVTGAACLFLAGKVEETPKKCRDIIKTARAILFDNQFEVFGDDPKVIFNNYFMSTQWI